MAIEADTPTPTGWQASALARETGFLLARSNALSLAASHAALQTVGLKIRSYPILALVCDGTMPTQRELAEALRLDPSQIVALVDELEGRGLLARQVDERDRRAKVLVPTDAGHALFAEARAVVNDAEKAALSPLTTAEREQFADLLRRIALADPTV